MEAYVPIEVAAEFLSVKVSHLYALVRTGKIPPPRSAHCGGSGCRSWTRGRRPAARPPRRRSNDDPLLHC